LVLQASALGQGGEVFALDMGEPIRIVDLAKDLIHLSGLEVGEDIDIVYTGLRPGEKLFEEIFLASEEDLVAPH
jgi:FlaA1/EpsC-like NDP-sugar epimerase